MVRVDRRGRAAGFLSSGAIGLLLALPAAAEGPGPGSVRYVTSGEYLEPGRLEMIIPRLQVQ
jgi:hypothetical protein